MHRLAPESSILAIKEAHDIVEMEKRAVRKFQWTDQICMPVVECRAKEWTG